LPTAYSYIRFSTSEQLKGDSLRRQTELSNEYAAQHNLTLDTSLHLQDLGFSAFDKSNVDRGALGGFLKAVEQGRVLAGSYLLVESLDRLSRLEVSDALELFLSIIRRDITIVTFSDNKVYNKASLRSNYTDLIVSITIMARAHEESLTKSRRIKAAWSNKRSHLSEKKLTAQCPKWMRLNDSRTAFEFIPERVEVVKMILEWAKNGMGQALIAKYLNERSTSQFSRHGKGWHSSYIQKILTSAALYGEFQPGISENGKAMPHGDPIENYYPALITKEEFFLLQNFRSGRAIGGAKARKGTTVPNLLSGVAKCGYCGSSMILVGAAAKRVRSSDGSEIKRPSNKVLVCDGGRRGLNCYAVQWNYKDFETSFLTFCRGLELGKILSNFDQAATTKDKKLNISEQVRATDSEISNTKTRLNNLLVALESGNPPSSIVERIRKTEADLAELVERRKKLETELQVVEGTNRHIEMAGESIRDLITQMESLTGEALFNVRVALADHIRRLIEVVKVFPAGRLVTSSHIEQLRNDLLEAGFSSDGIDEYIRKTQRIAPERQGRGTRGRYASRKDIGRHFLIQARNGIFRLVYPDFDDSSKLIVGSEVVQTENGRYMGFHPKTDEKIIGTVGGMCCSDASE
jgi:DNA invertase Pin-like site-specific DNA recombinase